MDKNKLKQISQLLRYLSLQMTTRAGSGHPTSSLSSCDLLAVLFASIFRYDFENPHNLGNDRLIFSKGHATPLYYSLYAVSGAIKIEELENYRKFGSLLEGHPTSRFPFAEAATGSLGQGLSVGVGLAIALRLQLRNPPNVYVLLGDGEMAEGSIWEAANLASRYKLDNLTAIVDVNRLGQSGETMGGWDTDYYRRKLIAFGWDTTVIDGHDFDQILNAYKEVKHQTGRSRPFAIIAKTIKGKGVSFLENKEGWHGKPVPPDQLEKALDELGEVDLNIRIKVSEPAKPEISDCPSSRPIGKFQLSKKLQTPNCQAQKIEYKPGEQVATRKAYGQALARLGEVYPGIVALDGDVKNSTYSEVFKEKFPNRFFEMYIAEQNMVGVAIGFARIGFTPFVSSFACFLTRAFDQIRMGAVGSANVKFCGSHAGVSIGQDGPSQMGLEDIAMFRTIHKSVVLYPSDAVSAQKLVEEMIKHRGICYLRTTRPKTPVIYDSNEEFHIGGCKIHKIKNPRLIGGQGKPKMRKIIIITAGITLFEAFKAQKVLAQEAIEAVVVDCYSIKPIDEKTLKCLAGECSNIITVEDHWFEGGLADAVLNVFAKEERVKISKLAVGKMPRSGKGSELLEYEGISANGIIKAVKQML